MSRFSKFCQWLGVFLLLMEAKPAHADVVGALVIIGNFLLDHIVAVALIAFNLVQSANARSRLRAEQQRRTAEYNASLQDRTAQILDSAPPWRIVVGQATVSGFVAANFTTDKNGIRTDGSSYVKPDGYRHLVVVFASHECEAINEIFLNGKAVGPLDVNGTPTQGHFLSTATRSFRKDIPASGFISVPKGVVKVIAAYNFTDDGSGHRNSFIASVTLANGNTEIHGAPGVTVSYETPSDLQPVKIVKHLGVPYDPVDSYLNGLKPQQWDATHPLNGHCYIVITLDLEFQEFQGGPPTMTADILGLKAYDPRLQLLTNPYLQGAAAGSPGTSPVNMTWMSTINGLSRTIVGVGEQYGIPYVDVRFSGTATATSDLTLFFAPSGSAPAAAVGDVVFGSAYIAKQAGTLNGINGVFLTLYELNGSTVLSNSSSNLSLPAVTSQILQDNLYQISRTFNQATVNQANLSVRIAYASGQAVDITLRLGLPTLSKSSKAIKHTRNPAIILRQFLLSEWGYACSVAEVNDPAAIVAANDCDTPTQFKYTDKNGTLLYTKTQERYTCNGAFKTSDSKEQVLQDIKASMAGFAIPSGQWYIAAGVWHPPVMDLTDDLLMGPIEVIQTGEPIAQISNGYRGNYFPAPIYGTGVGYLLNGAHTAGATSITLKSGTGEIPIGVGLMFQNDDTMYTVTAGINGPGTLTIAYPGLAKPFTDGKPAYVVTNGGQTTADFDPYQNTSYVAVDGKPLWDAVTFPYTNDKARCTNLARIKTEAKRAGLVLIYPGQMPCWPLQPNDRVRLTSSEYNYVTRTFRVTDWGWSPDTAVSLTIQDDYASIYDTVDAVVIDRVPDDGLPDPTRVQKLTNFDTASGTQHLMRYQDGTLIPRIYVSWDPINDSFVTGGQGKIVIAYQSMAEADPRIIEVSGDAVSAYIQGPQEFDSVTVSAWVVNGLGYKSDPVFDGVYVIGESEPPADVSNFTATVTSSGVQFKWDPNTEADYAATEIHVESSWSDLTPPLFIGPANTWTWVAPPQGSYTILIKHIDSTGHKSLNAVSQSVIVLTDQTQNNLLDSTWWRPGATVAWPQNTDDGTDANDFIWGVGPRGSVEALWRATAGSNGLASGGWNPGATNTLRLDPTKVYRFVLPVLKLSGTGSLFWGVDPNSVTTLNTSTPSPNPYFASFDAPFLGRWYYAVGYIYPAGQTGLANTGAGVYDTVTGASVTAGIAQNYNFNAALGGVTGTRAYQFYSAAGSQALFGHPMVHLVDGSEPSLNDLLQASAVLNSQQQWTDVNNRPKSFRAVALGNSAVYSHGGGLYNGETDALLAAVSRSYMVAVIRRSDGAVTGNFRYDVWGTPADVVAMTNKLASLGSDSIVAVVTYDEPQSNRLSTNLATQMYRCGASQAVYGSNNFKNRSAYVLVGVPGSGEGNGAEFYQGTTDGDTNAWVDISFFVQNGNIVGVSPAFTPRTLRDYNYLGDYAATKDISLLNFSGMQINGNAATKIGTSNAWDSSVFSADSFTGGAYASAIPGQTNKGVMLGLNSDPTTDGDFASIDYALYARGDGTLHTYENGVGVTIGTAYTSADVLAVVYDGVTVKYLKNGTSIRTISAPANLKLFLDTSFLDPGAVLNNIRFGPMSPVTGIDTGQLNSNSISETTTLSAGSWGYANFT